MTKKQNLCSVFLKSVHSLVDYSNITYEVIHDIVCLSSSGEFSVPLRPNTQSSEVTYITAGKDL